MFGDFFGFGNQEEEHRKGDMVVVPLMVTLEELYNGALIDMLRTKVFQLLGRFLKAKNNYSEHTLKQAEPANVTVVWKCDKSEWAWASFQSIRRKSAKNAPMSSSSVVMRSWKLKLKRVSVVYMLNISKRLNVLILSRYGAWPTNCLFWRGRTHG